MRYSWVAKAVLGACSVTAQSSTSASLTAASSSATSTSLSNTNPSSSTNTSSRGSVVQLSFPSISGLTLSGSVAPPTGSYLTVTSQTTAPTILASGNSSASSTSSSDPYRIVGATSTVANGTASTTTTSSATATNTQPCNNYPEFCLRKYSNITEICAHNAAFDKANNAFSNQLYGITAQLNDGIRMIEGEVHYENGTLYNCHSSCDFLNTGTYESTLVTVREWVEANPYNVVTILIANSDYADATVFSAPFERSNILPYVYLPPKSPMFLSDWPTLGEMILSNKRVVVFMDYMANVTAVPYILDQYT